ncbi:sialoadhesin-like [Polymixia lowei]
MCSSVKLSWCGELALCVVNAVKQSDSGSYWCESDDGDTVDAVNITVTGGDVMLDSPVLPVKEGSVVTLRCRTKTPSNLPADFYKDGSLISTQSSGEMTIPAVSKSDEGLYKCNISGLGESPHSWLAMEALSPPVSLTVSPSRSQLLEYESVSLRCEQQHSSTRWRVWRSVPPAGRLSVCGEGWGSPWTSGCSLHTAKKSDTATYWCESAEGQRSNTVDVSIHGGDVMLDSPVLPVKEGSVVTLRCRTKTPSNLPADFYKDGSLISTQSSGEMTIPAVSKSDEGLYKCNISGLGESPHSWLAVTAPPTDTLPTQAPPPPLAPLLPVVRLVCHLVVICPYCICTVLLLSIYHHRSKGNDPLVSMATAQPSQAEEGLDKECDDVIANVTTEHSF